MKKPAFIFFVLIVLASAVFSSCNGNGKKSEIPAKEIVKDQYRCPMKCTEELYDKPGKCPVCDMELEKITKS